MFFLLLACAERIGTVRTAEPSDGRGPAVVDPPIPAFELGMMDHVTVAGWSADGAELGWCADGMVRRCVFRALDGTETTLQDRPGPDVDPDPAFDAAMDARLAARGYGTVAGTWPYRDTLALTWAVAPGEPDVRDAVLQAGAKLVGGRPVYPATLSEPGFDRIHLEFLGLSPDGSHVGVISHAFRGEYSDTFRIVIVPISTVVHGAFSAGK